MFYGVSKSHLFLKVYAQCFMRFLYFDWNISQFPDPVYWLMTDGLMMVCLAKYVESVLFWVKLDIIDIFIFIADKTNYKQRNNINKKYYEDKILGKSVQNFGFFFIQFLNNIFQLLDTGSFLSYKRIIVLLLVIICDPRFLIIPTVIPILARKRVFLL